jgi:hypothetical protein
MRYLGILLVFRFSVTLTRVFEGCDDRVVARTEKALDYR